MRGSRALWSLELRFKSLVDVNCLVCSAASDQLALLGKVGVNTCIQWYNVALPHHRGRHRGRCPLGEWHLNDVSLRVLLYGVQQGAFRTSGCSGTYKIASSKAPTKPLVAEMLTE